jgi:hypothetical protein
LSKISHDIGDLFLLNEGLALIAEKRETLGDLGFEVLLALGFLGHGEVVVP